MSLVSYCGVPGSGKTLDSTYEALKHYKKQNKPIKKFFSYIYYKLGFKNKKIDFLYYKKFPKNKINSVYSNYPILLDPKNKIYSNYCNIWDLNNDFSFLPNSLIIIDEIQLYVDSEDYKDKDINKRLKMIAKFLQAHRHFGIDKIIFISQHPSRIFKKGRNICESYLKHKKVINIPIIPISIIRSVGYYELDYYGRYIPKDREAKKKLEFDYYKITRFFNRRKLYKAYDSRYLSNYNYNKPLIDYGTFDSLKLDFKTLEEAFKDDSL